MNKYLVPIGMVWVGLALIIGLVVSFSGLKVRGGGEGGLVKEIHYIKTVGQPEVPTSATAKVNIAGTVGEDATAQVEVKK